MEALLTTRRTISTEPATDKKQDSGADFMAKMKPEVAVSPACGTGRELLLQVLCVCVRVCVCVSACVCVCVRARVCACT